MDFNEAEQKRIQFTARLRSGQLTPPQYAKALTSLQVTDALGTIWQPNPSGDGWIFWTGSAWQSGVPPGIPGSGMVAGTGIPQRSAKDFNEFKSSLMSVDEFKKMSKDVPLAKRPQKWWDLLSILGGVVAAILWILYSGIREGIDIITPLLMIAIPIILVWFRADIDQMLQPLQPHRRKISKIILIGLGIATPFLTAWLLYNLFHISQYPLMQANMVVGTFVAYVITRDPQIGPGRQTSHGPVAGSVMIIFTMMICSSLVAPVLAHDCTSDLLNAQDCLRTDGYAEAMAGLIATILATLINGPIIIQGIIQGGAGTQVTGPSAPPASTPGGAGTATPPDGTSTDPAQAWIGSRTVYPGNWNVSPDGTKIILDGYPGYEIPIGWVTGTSGDAIENTIYNTDLPTDDHDQIANNVAQNTNSDDFDNFTKSKWDTMDNTARQKALADIAQTIGQQLGESGVTVQLDPTMTFTNGQTMDAVYDGSVIKLNPNSTYWNDPGKMVETIAHEVKHQQQWNPNNPMENQTSRDAATVNKDNYHGFDTDPAKYAGQYVENDSNSFGQKVRDQVRGIAVSNKEKKLFDFLDQLKESAGSPQQPEAPKITIEGIKQNPQGFLDHLNKNPDQKAKFIEILKRNKGGS